MSKKRVPPFPHFGVAVGGEPTVAHVVNPYKEEMTSACRISLRLMRSEAETHLPTCPACMGVARDWATGKSRAEGYEDYEEEESKP